MSYDFSITTNCPTKIVKSLNRDFDEVTVRVENLPVDGCRPIELFIGEGDSQEAHMLLDIQEFRELVNALEELCCHWEAGGA